MFSKMSLKSIDYLGAVNANPDDFEKLTQVFLEDIEVCNIKVPEFDFGFQWLNVKEKLQFNKDLRGKLCVLDFFTYCCINCMHILPDLHDLEESFSVQDGLVVLGIHSAKFQNEKILSNILSAVIRYDISHPVVNDPNAVLWNEMNIQCWPTLVVVSPIGQVLLYLVGEGHRNFLFNFVEFALKRYGNKGLLSCHALPIQLEKNSLKFKNLRYPGKLTASPCGKMLAVSDSGHHQVLIIERNGNVVKRIGSGFSGLKDGEAHVSQFSSPQGLSWFENVIFVADTENHSIREINVANWITKTIVGNGKQGKDKDGGKLGIEQEISSPWDVVVGASPGSDTTDCVNNCLYIAVAGTHQIWCYFLKDGLWLKKGHQKKEVALRFAGSGEEENRNNSYPTKASFAQPSGLAIIKNQLFVADSESSSIRSVDLKTGAVKGVVGADRDPTNLFSYGDVDGIGLNAKLQHPLDVAAVNGHLYVADSYNHKIKIVNLSNLSCTTLAGNGVVGIKNGDFLSAEFNEPGGIICLDDTIYIADTNNHLIRVLNLTTRLVSTLEILEMDSLDSFPVAVSKTSEKLLVGANTSVTVLDPKKCSLSNHSTFFLHVNLPTGFHYTDEVDSKWQLTLSSEAVIDVKTGTLNKDEISLTIPPGFSFVLIKVELILYMCSENGLCHMKQYVLHQNLINNYDAGNSVVTSFLAF
ncbi:NHL repeat-containing protein 2 [Hydra vulgaris]|uniref:NHL repeat-containing protein 2 n=1 Tax=Hydra vulgaris TaxID=6087 RepID=A0ABM4BM95_HYDVU